MKSQIDKQFLKTIGSRLRRIRKKLGWTLEHTEEKGWINWKHLQRIETGHKDMRICTLKRLADIYEIPLSDLLDGL